MAKSSKVKNEQLHREAKTFRKYALLTLGIPVAVLIFFFLCFLTFRSFEGAVLSLYGITFGFILSAIALIAGIWYSFIWQRRNWKYYVLPLIIPVVAGSIALSFYAVNYAERNTAELKRYNAHQFMCQSISNFEYVFQRMDGDVRLDAIEKTNIDADALNARITSAKGDIATSKALVDCDASLGMSEVQAKRVESLAPVVEQLNKDMEHFHSEYTAAIEALDGKYYVGDLEDGQRYKWN